MLENVLLKRQILENSLGDSQQDDAKESVVGTADSHPDILAKRHIL